MTPIPHATQIWSAYLQVDSQLVAQVVSRHLANAAIEFLQGYLVSDPDLRDQAFLEAAASLASAASKFAKAEVNE